MMKKLATLAVTLAALVLAFATLSPTAEAGWRRCGWGYWACAHWGWSVPGGWYGPHYRDWRRHAYGGSPYAYYPYWRGRYWRGWY
jgi:hypothetical protein